MSLAPFLEVGLVAALPAVAGEIADALVNDRDGPGSHPEAGLLGLAAEVEIIEVELEALVEAQALGVQRPAARGEKQPIEQLHVLAGRTPGADARRRIAASVPNHAAQVVPGVGA